MKRRKPKAAPAQQLLPWAITYIHTMNEELRNSHYSPRSQRIEPREVELEYRRTRRWLKRAYAALPQQQGSAR